ncbi:MAG: hypothetical protein LQ337_006873 [Flavoplaca oasis]|nr:MAG: hypothetical protein LQ337_006873 [Flavoplaca oasis]
MVVLTYLLPPPKPVINTPFSIRDNHANGTLLNAIDPTKLDVRSVYSDTKLPPTSILMTAVDTMVKVAMENWEGRMASTVFVIDDPKYSQVQFVIRAPNPGAQIPNAYAVLGTFLVMNGILSDPLTRFRSSFHRLYYSAQLVGSIEVRSSVAERGPGPELSKSPDDGDNELPMGANIANLSAPAWQDPRLQVSIARGPDTFTIYEIFYATYSLMRQVALNAAVQPRDAPLRDFTVTVDAPPITTRNYPIAASFRNAGNPPRTARIPPYFQPKWLIKALGQLPQKSLDSRNFKDVVRMGITVDGVMVGEGYVVRKQFDAVESS